MEGGSIKGDGDEDPFAHMSAETGVSREAFPVLSAVHRYFAECDADEQFEFGLDLMIRGMQAKVAAEATG